MAAGGRKVLSGPWPVDDCTTEGGRLLKPRKQSQKLKTRVLSGKLCTSRPAPGMWTLAGRAHATVGNLLCTLRLGLKQGAH